MLSWRSVREYLTAVVQAYQSFVLGLVFGVAGAIGLFVSDQSGVQVAALIGVALGFLVAPYRAFQRMQQERDIARSENRLDRLAIQWGYVNALSGGGWAIDGFHAPDVPGLVARALIATQYPLGRNAEISSSQMDWFRDAAASSPVARWLARHFPCGEEQQAWKLVAPCNGYEFTVERRGVASSDGGSEASARCMLLLPRGIYGAAPKLMVDVLFRDLPREPQRTGAQPDLYNRFELAGDPYRPDLPELVEVLETLAETLTVLTPVMLEPIVHRNWRERLRERFGQPVPLVGPNLHVRSRPRALSEALRLPDFPCFAGGSEQAELIVQTPPKISAYDSFGRLDLIRQELRRLLRTLQYRDFEEYVDELGVTAAQPHFEGSDQPIVLPR